MSRELSPFEQDHVRSIAREAATKITHYLTIEHQDRVLIEKLRADAVTPSQAADGVALLEEFAKGNKRVDEFVSKSLNTLVAITKGEFYPEPHMYQLFKHMSDNHNLTLLESEMNDIVHVVLEMVADKVVKEFSPPPAQS